MTVEHCWLPRATCGADCVRAGSLPTGQPLWVAQTDMPELEPDEYWAHDLEGCAVVDGATAVGVVRALVPLPSCEALDVERDGGGELLVPLVRDAIRSIDVAARRIDVDLAFLGESY